MSISSLRFLVPSALSLLATAASAQEVGTVFPDVVLEDFGGTGARSLDDFTGRAMLVEFFAHWCGPCAKQVPHLNELSERLGPRGLSILGVATENEDGEVQKTLKFIEKHGFAYGHAFDAESMLSSHFRVQSIPFAVLVDPSGVVVWSGHPSRLTDETLEKALAGALKTPLFEWPAEAKPLADALRRGHYKDALALAQSLELEIDGVAPAALVQQRVEALSAGVTASLERAVERGDYHTAFALAERGRDELAGLPEGGALATRLAELEKDETAKKTRRGQDAIARLEFTLVRTKEDDVAALRAARAELVLLAKEHAGTKVGERADEILKVLARFLEPEKP